MEGGEEFIQPTENADIQYILDLFDKEELGLTITEDTEENERSSNYLHKSSGENIDQREDISDSKYRSAFIGFFKTDRQEAVSFIDAAIRFMNSVKKLKMEDLLQQLSSSNVMRAIMGNLITSQLLVEPIEEQLAYADLSEADTRRYKQALELLKAPGPLSEMAKNKIQALLGEIEAH